MEVPLSSNPTFEAPTNGDSSPSATQTGASNPELLTNGEGSGRGGNGSDGKESPSDAGKNLFDEWKYRHEMFYKILYRYVWALIVLAVLPLIPLPSQISAEFLHQVHQWGLAGIVYWGLVIATFGGTSLHLMYEFRYCQAVRERLEATRKTLRPEILSWREYRQYAWWKQTLYVLGFSTFFGACIYLPAKVHRESVVSRMENSQSFKVVFSSLPPECQQGSITPGAYFMVRYDPETIAWIATGRFAGKQSTESWGARNSQHTTSAEYKPERHILILGGAAFWFDDEQRLFQNCGNIETRVGEIVF